MTDEYRYDDPALARRRDVREDVRRAYGGYVPPAARGPCRHQPLRDVRIGPLVWMRDMLPIKTRMFVAIATVAALDREDVKYFMRSAFCHGAAREVIEEVLLVAGQEAGYPAAIRPHAGSTTPNTNTGVHGDTRPKARRGHDTRLRAAVLAERHGLDRRALSWYFAIDLLLVHFRTKPAALHRDLPAPSNPWTTRRGLHFDTEDRRHPVGIDAESIDPAQTTSCLTSGARRPSAVLHGKRHDVLVALAVVTGLKLSCSAGSSAPHGRAQSCRRRAAAPALQSWDGQLGPAGRQVLRAVSRFGNTFIVPYASSPARGRLSSRT